MYSSSIYCVIANYQNIYLLINNSAKLLYITLWTTISSIYIRNTYIFLNSGCHVFFLSWKFLYIYRYVYNFFFFIKIYCQQLGTLDLVSWVGQSTVYFLYVPPETQKLHVLHTTRGIFSITCEYTHAYALADYCPVVFMCGPTSEDSTSLMD